MPRRPLTVIRHLPATPWIRCVFRLSVAAILCSSGIACTPADPVEEARARLVQGEALEAVDQLREVLNERPDEPEILLLYGQALAAAGKISLAEWPLRKAMRFPEWTVPAGLEVAYLGIRTMNYTTAIEALNQVLERDPENLRGLLLRANAYAQSKFDAEAGLADVATLRELEPDNVESFKPEVLSLLALERIEEANAALGALGERIDAGGGDDSTRAWYCTTMALFAYESREFELAATRWNDCLDRYPSDSKIVTEAVAFFDQLNDYARSFEIAEKAVEESDLSAVDFRVLLAQRLNMQGQGDEAEALLREGVASPDRQLTTVYGFELAQFLDMAGKIEAAHDAAEQALSSSREFTEPHPSQLLDVADLAIRAGRLDRALSLADEISLEAYSLLVRARVAHAQDDYRAALAHYDAAAVLWPDNSFARYHAARAAEALGEFDRALELYRHATRISAEDTDSQTRIARIQLAQGPPSTALGTLQTHHDRGLLEPEGELLYLRLVGRSPRNESQDLLLQDFAARHPELAARAVASVVEGLLESDQRRAALELMATIRDEFLLYPGNSEALRAFVLLVREPSEVARAGKRASAAIERHPESSELLEIEGLVQEIHRNDLEAARNAYTAAIGLDPENAHALARIGRIEVARDPAAAVKLLGRALAVEHPDFDPIREAARDLIALGEGNAAEGVLELILDRVPYDGEAAELLCRLRLAAQESSEGLLDLARRAARFHASAATRTLLSEVESERHDDDQSG